jgi:hypothetical protein
VVVLDLAEADLPIPCRSALSPELLQRLMNPRRVPPVPKWSEKGLSFATDAEIEQFIRSVPSNGISLVPHWTAGLEKAVPAFGGFVSSC